MSQTPVISSATTVSPEETSKTTSRPHPPKIVVLADLNVDPPTDPDVIDSFPRFSNEENSQDKMSFLGKDSDTVELESKQIKKLGKARSRMGKMEFPIDCGADAEGDHNSPGVPSSREEKVSSLKTGLVHVARKMPKNTHVHFILGLMYQRMGQPQKAVSAYEKAEEILLRGDEDIDRPDLLSLIQTHHAQCILLGSSEEYGSGKEPEGKELEDILCKLNESMASDVRQASVWNTLGVLLLKSGHLQSAISVLSSLLAIVPENLDCIGNLGMAHLQNGNLELSAKCFQDLILKDQNHPSVFINYAALLLCKYGSVVAGAGANGDNGACLDRDMAVNVAKECLLAAAKADPKAAHVWTNLANAYYMAGDHRHSGKCLEKAAKLESNCLATRYAVAVHRIREAERSQNPSEQLSWAGNEMASILKEGDSLAVELPIAWAGLAMVHKAQHEIAAGFKIEQNELMEVEERALHSLKQAISEDPDDPVQWHQLGLHNLCTQDFITSQTYLKEAVARDRECSYAWSNLGISLQLSDASSSQAEEVYKRALSLAKPEQAHTIFCNLGNFYRQQQQYECAKAMFTKSLDLQPGYAPAYNNLGLVFVAERRWEEAKFCFNKAFQADPLLDAAKSNMIKAAAMCRVSIHNLTSSGEGSSENANEGHQEGGKNSEKSPVWITSEGGAGLQGKTQKHHMRRPRIFTPHWRLLEDARFYNAQDCEEWLHHSIPPAECLHVQSKERIQLLQDGAVGLAMAAASFSELKREYQRHSDAAEELAMERNEIVAFRAKYEAESVNQQRKLAAAERATKQIEEGYAKAHQEWKVSRDRENAVLAKECERARRFEVEKDKLQAKVKALEKEMEEEKAKSAAARVDAKAKDQELKQHVTWTSALELESGALKMEVAKLKADKTTIAKECESLRTEKLSAEKLMVEAQAAQVETQADLDWLMSSGIQGIYKRIWDEPALTQCVANLLNKSQQYGLKKGFLEGFNFCLSGKNIEQNPFHDIDAEAEYDAEMEAYENISFSIMDVVAECAKHPEGSKIFRAAIEEADGAAAGGGGEGMSDTYHEEEEGDAKLVDYD